MSKIIQIDTSLSAFTLTQSFRRYFRVEFALTQAQKRKVYSMRYNVYCKEFGYEPIDQFPDELEYDAYDEYSFHCLIIHRKTGAAAACVRIVPAISNNHDDQLPFERFCIDNLDTKLVDEWNFKRQTVCEVSRLVVDGAFRKHSGELSIRFGKVITQISQHEQQTFKKINEAVVLASIALTELTGRTNVYAMMGKLLPRLLKRSGICFQRIGEDIDHHGIRAPYFITTHSALDKLRPELLELYQWIKKEIVTVTYKKTA